MKLLTANRLNDGRVIYLGEADAAVETIAAARPLDAEAAETALALAQSRPAVFVNPYLIEVEDRTPTGRDRLKERIRSAGPTVGHSLGFVVRNETA
ncbi:MAG: DUF2849 domain-containing protein [Candidatus Brevundimonas phytovorans]|nr:DUF2849 domain-containing protein [Brevundimonas sp.]WEK59244.1 MAG: DUF2849 domain-containing protein [Brevundimonas sp.]